MIKVVVFLILGFIFVPNLTFAVNKVCSGDGYTVATINGIFTDEGEAQTNMIELQKKLGFSHGNQEIIYQYLLNATHFAGFGDGLKAFKQKVEEGVPIDDYDLIEMLKEASEKVTTQKLLLVAHSQGNFYANSFYDKVANKDGGVPKESIGVYGVATPSNHVSGDGKYLTSKTDKVIAGLVGSMPFFGIMPPNTDIELKEGDSILGHSFSDIYLKYKPAKIISDIEWSLDKLKTNDAQKENEACIDAPELTVAHKVTGAVLAVADPVAEKAKAGIVATVVVTHNTGVFVVKIGTSAVGAVSALGNAVAQTTFTATVWTYQTGVSVAKTTASMTADVIFSAYSAVKSLVGGGNNMANNNMASVVLANGNQGGEMGGKQGNGGPQNLPQILGEGVSVSSGVSEGVDDQTLQSIARMLAMAEDKVAEIKSVIDGKSQAEGLVSSSQTDAVSGSENTENDFGPKIIYIGLSPGYGGGEVQKELVDAGDSSKILVPKSESSLSAPSITVSQCDYSLATDGCLLATTTVHFAWSAVSGAEYYEVNKNGVISTTTDTSLDVSVTDFSDYSFKLLAKNTATTSPVSAKIISVATIPIAINEIAWMGTVASSNDEWMELKNNTEHTIDLSQWALTSRDDTPYIVLSGTMAPNEYRVLERRANSLDINAQIDTYGNGASQWALGNGGEEIILSYASTTLDSTPIISGATWAQGTNGSTVKKSMERYSSNESGANVSNWGTNRDFMKNGTDTEGNEIDGTPGAKNSVSYLINKGQDINSDLTLTALDGYFISTSTTVMASSTLTIEPGVVIKFLESDSGQTELKVIGEMKVLGTSEDNVVFEAFSGEQVGRIRFVGGVGATSTIDFAQIKNINGVQVKSSSKVEISNTQFLENNYGLEVKERSTAIVSNSSFASTTREAVQLYENSNITIFSTTITDILDSDAIGIYGGSSLNISSSTIDKVQGGGGIGVYDSSAVITDLTVNNVYSGDGIGVYDSSAVIEDSTINNVYSRDGIGVYDSSMVITDTTVSNIRADGIGVYDSTLNISSSTIKDVSRDALGLYDSNSTIVNTVVQNGEANGIYIGGGEVTITGGSVSGFSEGTGIYVSFPTEPVVISGTEVSGNDIGISADSSAAVTILPDVSVHDNGQNLDIP